MRRWIVFLFAVAVMCVFASGARADEGHNHAVQKLPLFDGGDHGILHLSCPLNTHMHPGDICPHIYGKRASGGTTHIGQECGGIPHAPGTAKVVSHEKPALAVFSAPLEPVRETAAPRLVFSMRGFLLPGAIDHPPRFL